MAKVVDRYHINEGWREYDLVVREAIVEDGQLNMTVVVDPDSVVIYRRSRAYAWLILKGLVRRIGRSLHRI